MNFKYPLRKHKAGGFYPETGGCGFCGGSNKGKFVVITMSAMERVGDGNTFVPADVKTSLQFIDHGVTETGKGYTIFENTNDAFFCSTRCLRQFFNCLVDDFEEGK